jgi:hypothetical protein
MAGCGASEITARAGDTLKSEQPGKIPVPKTANERSRGLIAMLTAAPVQTKIGSAVQFEVTASVRHALGAVGYQLSYGDGTSAENVVPQFCIAGRGASTRQTWHLSHRYRAAGRYRVSVSVYVNCTREHATATVAVYVM